MGRAPRDVAANRRREGGGQRPRRLELALAGRPGAGPAPCRPRPRAESRVRGHRRAHSRVGHRREHRDVQHRLRPPAPAAAVSGRRRDRAGGVPERRAARDRVAHQPHPAAAPAGSGLLRARRGLCVAQCRLEWSGWPRHPPRSDGLALRLPAPAGDAPSRPAPCRGGCTRRRTAGRPPEPQRLDQPVRVGPGHRGRADRAGRRGLHRGRRARRGVRVPEPRGGGLDADGHVVRRPGPGCGGPHPDHLVRLLGARAPPPRRLAGTGRGRGRYPAAPAGHSATVGPARVARRTAPATSWRAWSPCKRK